MKTLGKYFSPNDGPLLTQALTFIEMHTPVQLSYEDFCVKISGVLEDLHKVCGNRYCDCTHIPRAETKVSDLYLYTSWVTGGQSGGSCWDTEERHQFSSMGSEPEPEFQGLSKMMEDLKINVSKYHKIKEKLQYIEWTQNEYYGNYTNYRMKYISVRDLYNVLFS